MVRRCGVAPLDRKKIKGQKKQSTGTSAEFQGNADRKPRERSDGLKNFGMMNLFFVEFPQDTQRTEVGEVRQMQPIVE